MPGADVTTSKYIHGATQRFAWKRLLIKLGRQGYKGVGGGQIVGCVGVIAECGYALAYVRFTHVGAYCVNDAPSLVTRRAGLKRIFKPRPSFPHR
jgi:hypothetical protein